MKNDLDQFWGRAIPISIIILIWVCVAAVIYKIYRGESVYSRYAVTEQHVINIWGSLKEIRYLVEELGIRTEEMPHNISDEKAVLAIIGEAEDQGMAGMIAVGEAIRNRGHLRGVYGLTSYRVTKRLYSKKIYKQAQKAWRTSRFTNIVGNSDSWRACSKPIENKIKIKDHCFYTEKSYGMWSY